MSNYLSVLSAGAMVYDVLANDAELLTMCNKVFPLVSEVGATLPYIVYRRSNISGRGYKSVDRPLLSANTAYFEVACYADSYRQSMAMAERVAHLLDNRSFTYTDDETGDTLVARNIRLTDAEELWQYDAYSQILTFEFKV